MIDLVLEGVVPPTVDRVSERAGVSQASLFRYFGTLEELRREAIARYFERFADLLAVPGIGDGPLPGRIERFVAARDVFYDRTAPMARLVRRQAADVAAFSETLGRVRSTFADQAAQHFSPELDHLDRATCDQCVAVIAALTSFEAWDQLADLGAEGRRAALRRGIADLLGGAQRPAPSRGHADRSPS